MNIQSWKYLRIAAVLSFLGGVSASSDITAQDLDGFNGLMRTADVVQHQAISRLPVRVLLSDLEFGKSQIGVDASNGEMRTLQNPESALHTKLTAYGMTSFKRLRLEGQFGFIQEQENQIGWKLGRNVIHQPYYYANIRPGDWDNDRYSVNMNGGTTFFNDRLLLAFGIDYEVEKLARFNDPRPLINYHNLYLKAQLGVRLGNHVIAFYGGQGDAKENGIVRNYNISNDSFGRTEYNLITITGLGSYELLRRSQFEHPSSTYEAGLTYAYSNSQIVFSSDLVYRNRTADFIRRGSSGGGAINETMGTYDTDTFEADVFVSLPRSAYTLQLISNTSISDAYDYNVKFGGANYFNSSFTQNLRIFYHSNREHLSLFLDGGFSDVAIDDRNASHAFEHTRFSAGLGAQFSKMFGKQRYTLIPGIDYSGSLSDDLRILSGRENMFSRYVLYPDYYIQSSDYIGFQSGLQVQHYFNNLSVALLVNYRMQRIVSEGFLHPDSEFSPGSSRNSLSVTLQFFH
ncbi:MAG: hypothetical protein LAT57_12395 [Balneolales bacterium]|nr:hypothetical protein [Balneolales bacterium]